MLTTRLRFIEPQLPSLVDQPPEGKHWIHEIKHDGYRSQVLVERGEARVFTRNGYDWSDRYPGIVRAAANLRCQSAIIDGEAIVQDGNGASDILTRNGWGQGSRTGGLLPARTAGPSTVERDPMTLRSKTAFLALLIFAALPTNSLSADEAPKRTISLAASGAIKTTPDKVDISTGVTAQAPTAKEALAKNSAAMTEVIAALKGEGLDPKDIQTTNFSVQPLYEERKDGRAPKIVGYQVTNSVRITVRDVGKLGQILDRVVTLGATDVNSIEFGVAEPEALKDEARKLAMRNAIANAKLYAEAAGAKLGKVLTISEDQGIIVARSMAPAPMEMAAKAVPIEAGTATVEARVSVTFELE